MPTSAQARQKGSAPTAFTVTPTSGAAQVKAEATAKAEGARSKPLENNKTTDSKPHTKPGKTIPLELRAKTEARTGWIESHQINDSRPEWH